MKTFFVQTTSPILDHRDMFIEAEDFEKAEAIGERVSGARMASAMRWMSYSRTISFRTDWWLLFR